MKTLSVLLLLTAVSSFYAVPSYARPTGEPPKVTGGVVPPECANADNQTKHPDWYRDGGYCTADLGNIDGDGPAHAVS